MKAIGLLCSALVLVSAPTLAAEKPAPRESIEKLRVVLVTNHADARIMPLLKAELEALGIEVVLVDHGENEVIPRDLSAAARKTKSLAGFRVIVAKGSVEVWIADRVTGKVVLREALQQDADSKTAESVVVLRAVELLRVSLMELDAPHAPRGEVEPPQAIEKIAGFPGHRGKHALEIGGQFTWLSSDLPGATGAHLAYRYRFAPYLHAGASVGSTMSTVSAEADAGTAHVGSTRAHFFLGVHRKGSTAFLQPTLRLGPGVLWTRIQGDSNGGLDDFQHDVFSPLLTLEARLRLRLSRALSAWAAASGDVVFARPAIDIDAERAVSFSPVSVSGLLGLQVAWP